MVVAPMYPASRIVVKPIGCEHTSTCILVDNMLLLCYVYTMSPAATAVTISTTVDETG